MTVTYTGISAKLKPNGVLLVAELPDGEDKSVLMQSQDIREFWACNPSKWLEMYQDNEPVLWEAFSLVDGIHLHD